MSIKQRILQALRKDRVPGLLLQGFALLLIIGYYNVPAVTEVCTQIGEVKLAHGYLFSSICTGLFGGLLPYLILLVSKRIERDQRIAVGLFYVLFWMWKGIEVDFLYRTQGLLFGNGTDALTIVKKVMLDQFVFNPFYAVIGIALFYRWKDCRFSYRAFVASVDKKFFSEVVLTMLFSTWMIWIPTTAIVYSMPAPLQMPLFNIVLCFYVLLLTFIGSEKEPAS